MPKARYLRRTSCRCLARGCAGLISAGLLVAVCMGLMCRGDDGIDRPLTEEQLTSRIDAASDALTVSGGHDYGPITELLEEYYGDEETTTLICGQFIDPPHCLRIAAVNIQESNLDPIWQEQFCTLEKQAWESFPADVDPDGHFEECMTGLPFLAY